MPRRPIGRSDGDGSDRTRRGAVYAPAIDAGPGTDPQLGEVLAANDRFYAAFEARDMDAMSEVWDHDDRVVCTHPGWATLRGWGSVAASWFALFQGPEAIQFILTDVHAARTGDVAWVSLDENIIGRQLGSTVATLNLFARTGAGWRLVAHHGSPVAGAG